MSMESFQNKPEKLSEHISDTELLRARNEMQIKLAARFYGFEIEDEKFGEWVERYSERFGDLVAEHPELLEEYVHGEADEAIDKVSDLLYEKHGAGR